MADVNILIVGNSQDSSQAYGGLSRPFSPAAVQTELQNILSGAGLGTVNVGLEDRGGTFSLFEWFHYPYPANVETSTRWPKLRGEQGAAWDYVVLIGDPYTMEKMPGLYAQGVAAVAQEVAKGSGETVLLMPWPAATSTSTVEHYRDVVYRVGISGGYKVAPAALAWQAAGKPVGATHPSSDGAYIAAATIYSSLFGQSASTSAYTYNNTLANIAHTTATNTVPIAQYTGDFAYQNPFLMLGDKRRQMHFSHKGTSTERGFSDAVQLAMERCKVSYLYWGVYIANNGRALYSTNTPYAEGAGWPTSQPLPTAWNLGRKFDEPDKQYEVNADVWQLAFGFRYESDTPDPDIHLSQIGDKEIDLANFMIGQDNTARLLPWRMLYAQLISDSPIYPGAAVDGTGHLTSPVYTMVGTYLYTLYSGRCPVDPKPAEPVPLNWYAMKTGYEMAWRVGRCQSRAPGFKVMPVSAITTESDVTPTTSRTMSVFFINRPNSDVTVSVSVDDPYVGTVSTSLLTFTPENYDQPQTVTVGGLTGRAGALPFKAVFRTSSNDPAYDGVSDAWPFVNTRADGPVPGSVVLKGNGLTIWPAYTAPLTTDGTDFGTVSGPVSRLFTISNTSATQTLNLTKTPRVSVTDPSGYFTLSQDALTNVIGPGSSTTFQVTFNPPPGVIHTATVTVESDNTAIPAYSFKVTGSRLGTPTVVDNGAVPSTTTGARFHGVLSQGVAANVSVCWGAKDGGTASTTNWENVTSIGAVTQGLEFTGLVTGLNVNRSYVYRLYVSNAAGSSWSTNAQIFNGEPTNTGTGVSVDPIVFNATTNTGTGLEAPGLSTNITYSSIIHGWDRVTDAFGGSSHPDYDATAFMFGNGRVPDDGDAVMGNWLKTPNTSPYGDGFFWAKESVEWIAWNTTAPVTLAGYQLDLSSARSTTRIRLSVNGVVVDTFDNGGALTNGLLNRYFDQPVSGSSFKLEVTCLTTAGPLIREIDAILPTQTLRVANLAPSGISNNQATINGRLWAAPDNSTVTLHWGTTDGGNNPAAWQSSVVLGSWTNVTTNLSHVLSSLLPGTRYHYTFSSSSGSTTAWASPSWQFETTGTPALPQIINTQGATDITETNAFLRGWLTSIGGATTTVTCYWNPNSDPGATTTGWAYSRSFGTASGPGQYTHDTANNATLVAGTTYFYRYRAVNSFGTSWSGAASFTPLILPHVGNSTGPSAVSDTSATLRGVLTAGGSANAWICWGQTDGGQSTTGAWDHVISMGTVSQGATFSTLVTGLSSNTTYFYRCFVSNATGQDWSSAASFSGNAVDSTATTGFLNIRPAPTSIVASSIKSGYPPTNLFDATVTAANIGVTSYGTTDGQYAGYMNGPHTLFMDFGSALKADKFVYSQRQTSFTSFGFDTVPRMEFWFEANNPGTTVPARTPDANITITNTTNSILTLYSLGGTFSSRYVVVRLANNVFDPGGSEFRFVGTEARITNLAPSGIADNAATLNAQLNAAGGNYTAHVYYGTQDGGTNPAAWASSALVGTWNNTSVNVSNLVSSLLPGTRYYYRFRASSGSDIVWASPSWQFTTAGTPPPATYTVSYNGNGNTGGIPPANQTKTEGINLTLAANTGNLVKSGHTFLGWNTAADGTGTDYASGATYSLNAALTLYTKWSNTPPAVSAGAAQTVYLKPQATPWTPASLSLAAWYDASDTTKITTSAGAVSQWADKSGNGNHATQATASNKPTSGSSVGGLNAITFDGTNDFLSAANESNFDLASYSIFVVGAATNAGSFVGKGDVNQSPTTTNTARRKMQFKRGVLGSGADGNYATLSNGSTDSNAAIRSVIALNNTTVNYSYNGLFAAASIVNLNLTANNNVPLTIGSAFSAGAEFLSGTVGEIIIIGSAVDNVTRQKIEGYLAHKWGLAAQLPADHPYKTAAPGVLGVVVDLQGTATDNDGDTLTLSWSVVSGPGAVVFGNASVVQTTASFSTAGTYVLRLTANDGRAQSYNDVTITVVAPPANYLTWANGTFANAFTQTGLDQNQDGDAMTNLQEFAFGMDPTKADGDGLLTNGSTHGLPIPVSAGGSAFELYFVRRDDQGTSGSVSYTVQFSSDLTTFYDSSVAPTFVADSSANSNYELVKVPYPTSLPNSQPARFARVMVTPVP